MAMAIALVSGPRPGTVPRTHRGVKSGCVHSFQDTADGRFIRRLESPRQRIMTPRQARTCGGASATHSPMAVNDRALASTAAAAASNNDVSVWRTPRGSRGSGTRARYSSRPGR
jgi:hypothetical protein